MTEPSEHARQLRSYAEWVEQFHPPFDPAAIRSDDRPPVELEAVHGLRSTSAQRPGRRSLVGAAAAVALLVGTGLFVARQNDSAGNFILTPGTSGTSGTLGDDADRGPGSSVVSVPRRPVGGDDALGPVDADPEVSCHPESRLWFRRSALDGPKGAEFGTDGAAAALRDSLGVQKLADQLGGPLGLPTSDFRRLAETPDHVLFGGGDFAGNMPMLSFVQVDLIGGVWGVTGTTGGSCNQLTVRPPAGYTFLRWGVDRLSTHNRDSTELVVSVDVANPSGCDPVPIGDQDVAAMVEETSSTITVRVALKRPEIDLDAPNCVFSDRVRVPEPLTLALELGSPLGDRTVVDANVFPARTLDLNPEPRKEPPPPNPRLDLPGGTKDVTVLATVTDPACVPLKRSDCPGRPVPAAFEARLGDEIWRVGPNEVSNAVDIRAPATGASVTALVDGAWCPRVLLGPDNWAEVACTRLDQTNGHVTGSASRPSTEGPLSVVFRRTQMGPSVTHTVESDGSYEVVLVPGDWFAEVVGPGSTSNCPGRFPVQVTVTVGVTVTSDITCPT